MSIMGVWIAIGAGAGALLGIGGIFLWARRRVRRFSRQVFGTDSLLQGLKEADVAHLESPRSLNGCDALLLPKILADFPDFDPNLAFTYARRYITEQLAGKEKLTVYRIVISKYLRTLAQKTIVMQAAVGFTENGQRFQNRYELDYTFILDEGSEHIAANCPNCGGALGFGESECPYCGCRVASVLNNTWKFTAMREN